MAITRAKRSLWILGHVDSLRQHNVWRELVEDAEERGCVVRVCLCFCLLVRLCVSVCLCLSACAAHCTSVCVSLLRIPVASIVNHQAQKAKQQTHSTHTQLNAHRWKKPTEMTRHSCLVLLSCLSRVATNSHPIRYQRTAINSQLSPLHSHPTHYHHTPKHSHNQPTHHDKHSHPIHFHSLDTN